MCVHRLEKQNTHSHMSINHAKKGEEEVGQAAHPAYQKNPKIIALGPEVPASPVLGYVTACGRSGR